MPEAPQPYSSSVHPQDESPDTLQQQFVFKQPPVYAESASNTPVTVVEDTLIRVRTNAPLNTSRAKDGDPLLFTVSQDVAVGNILVIPRGATVHGTVVRSRKSGVLTGTPELTLKLVSLDLGGRSYPLYTYQFKQTGDSKAKPTETKIKGGAVVGAIVGGAFSGSAKGGYTGTSRAAGMATGAAVGAGVGTIVSAATPGPRVWIPSESQMDFYLASPISVTPVNANAAAQLGQGVSSGGPTCTAATVRPSLAAAYPKIHIKPA